MTRLLFIVGSLRAASASKAMAASLAERLSGEAEIAFADIGALPHYNADAGGDPGVEAFKSSIERAAGIVFVTPEYNYSIPGVLKNAIDWASRPAFNSVFLKKPCFVVSVSGGALGGVRAQGHLKYVLNGMLAHVFPLREVIVPFANDKVTDGLVTDEAVLTFATETLREFLRFVQDGTL